MPNETNEVRTFDKISSAPAEILLAIDTKGRITEVLSGEAEANTDKQALTLDTFQEQLDTITSNEKGRRVLRCEIEDVEVKEDGTVDYTLKTPMNGVAEVYQLSTNRIGGLLVKVKDGIVINRTFIKGGEYAPVDVRDEKNVTSGELVRVYPGLKSRITGAEIQAGDNEFSDEGEFKGLLVSVS